MTKSYTYRTIIEPDGKFFHGYVPALSGCHTFGKTIAETKRHLKDAIEVYIESLIQEKKIIPSDASFESFETVSFPYPHKVYA
ncbi:hypothetical protein A2W67_00330 [Candidatus Nomurabacteria bacterium RIFCSPLOWO2_02_40_28]|uniref:HicB-like antitoxin of toxin-antitoxin system domain-containing protein n=2 Tax=Candidatus Nomuraibacteriota TaxID=1752729 RepID=A0A837HVB2_9BACT|nr:MAG: hypothetical protein UT27_C0006G0033 [Candidatus Nomurabacteria bacterium GW2011_GWD2_39_12]KKR20162.1 MAG: hypothetical protein UT51_C0007G0016 [Candidatus Nomurabacteria bacterium GW2011_GWC2_39_41]KKR36465.1 MAG: hypothetical protein UT70_C0012G0007 [Candidatus Nomurabacteria bacterium GW2011_GWE2_40_10]KKR38217.1 MAG: hypothetical protein UT73_C0005G0034 [Candidatus Nomurabacteria bacterium GW2011_GWB1_40_11]KKR39950.1 MAG: hypothetical protein UT74_C0004G0033 [Parcubacteria group b